MMLLDCLLALRKDSSSKLLAWLTILVIAPGWSVGWWSYSAACMRCVLCCPTKNRELDKTWWATCRANVIACTFRLLLYLMLDKHLQTQCRDPVLSCPVCLHGIILSHIVKPITTHRLVICSCRAQFALLYFRIPDNISVGNLSCCCSSKISRKHFANHAS